MTKSHTRSGTFTDVAKLLHDELNNKAAGFSIGCLGAIAEYHDPDGALSCVTHSDRKTTLAAASTRGAIRVELSGHEKAIAYEILTKAIDTWQCGIAITVPKRTAATPPLTALTELGPERRAINEQDQGDILFDLGVAMPNVRYCVRTGDPNAIAHIRKYCGQVVVARDHPLIDYFVELSPHRVATSAAGRIEVYQRIDRHRTPDGPHTHLLPELLNKRRTHSANLQLPEDQLPVLMVYPPNPVQTAEGERISFSRGDFDHFEEILSTFGDRRYYEEKIRFHSAVNRGMSPHDYTIPNSRIERIAMRIALRQLPYCGASDEICTGWRQVFSP